MPSRPAFSPDFSWLSPLFRPTRAEVRAYADMIREADLHRGRDERSLLKQAELQLWVWRTENRQPAPRLRRAPRVRPREELNHASLIGHAPAG